MLIGTPLSLAILLASVAPATAPAATVDVIRESGAKGPVSQATLGVVAIDDAWGVILFSLFAAAAEIVAGDGGSLSIVAGGVRELVGGAVLGCALGLPMAWLTGRVRPGELTLVETLGFVFLCSGLALLYEFSMILACMAMGATVSNTARHHERPFHAIEEVEQPFLMAFFLLAGFDFRLSELRTIGLLGLTYLVARSAGKIIGAGFGARLAGASIVVRKHIGWCLIPQAGVALGLALVIAERFPEGSRVLTVIVGTTVVFELLGPLFTRGALRRAGEIPDATPGEKATEC